MYSMVYIEIYYYPLHWENKRKRLQYIVIVTQIYKIFLYFSSFSGRNILCDDNKKEIIINTVHLIRIVWLLILFLLLYCDCDDYFKNIWNSVVQLFCLFKILFSVFRSKLYIILLSTRKHHWSFKSSVFVGIILITERILTYSRAIFNSQVFIDRSIGDFFGYDTERKFNIFVNTWKICCLYSVL